MVGVAALVVAVVVGVLMNTRSGDNSAAPPQVGSGSVEPSASPAPVEAPAKLVAKAPTCPDEAAPFQPTSIDVPGVARGVPVITPPRDANDVPGTPPETSAGKHVFAFDREQHIEPGDSHGNVLLNTHTWPDGSALGNQLLSGLHHDGRIILVGHRHAQKLCYRVTRRIEVLATANVPEYYSRDGIPQLAIIVCSGRRLGPGNWEKRTIWYASPSV